MRRVGGKKAEARHSPNQWCSVGGEVYSTGMTPSRPDRDDSTLACAEQASAALRRERTMRALADVDAGRLIEDEAMMAWAERLGTDQEVPAPEPR